MVLSMNQIALALEHYWYLRAQGVRPVRAQAHVRQRFGVEVSLNDVEESSEACEEVVREPSTEFGTEFVGTSWGTSTGPQYGMRAHSHNFTWEPGQAGHGRCACGAEAPFPIAPMTELM